MYVLAYVTLISRNLVLSVAVAVAVAVAVSVCLCVCVCLATERNHAGATNRPNHHLSMGGKPAA